MSSRSIAVFSVLGAVLAAGLVVGPGGTAHAAGATIYVDDRSAAGCLDAAGSGSQAQPFCTIQGAADAAQPGDTVSVSPGVYAPVHLTVSGTPDAPITIAGSVRSGLQQTQLVTPSGSAGTALDFDHVHDIVVSGMFIGTSRTSSTATVTASSGILLAHDHIAASNVNSNVAPGLFVDGQSSAVTVQQSWLDSGLNGNAVTLASGAQGTVLTDNLIYGERQPAVLATDATGTDIISNSIASGWGCYTGLSLAGASSGATVENNRFTENEAACATQNDRTSPVLVSAGSAVGTRFDYNSITTPAASTPNYQWGGQPYATAAELFTATKAGAHDLGLIVDAQTTSDQRIAAYADSADANAPHELDTDYRGQARVDDPVVPNTGTGVGYYDRGASEVQDPYAFTISQSATKGPVGFDETISLNESNPWHTQISSYTYDFGDGTTPVTTSATSYTHAYTTPTAPNNDDRIKVSATTADGRVVAGGTGAVTVVPDATLVPVLRFARTDSASPLSTFVDASGTQDAWSIHSYTVNYGDGSGDQPLRGVGRHVFPHAGTYTARLTVVDDGGRTATSVTNVTLGSAFQPMVASSLIDTRTGLGGRHAQLLAGAPVRFKVAGVNGIPAQGVTAVTLNLTAMNASSSTWLTAYASGASVGAPIIHALPGQIVPHLVTVPVGADGYVALYNRYGKVDATAEVQGFYSPQLAAGYSTKAGYVQTVTPNIVFSTHGRLNWTGGKLGTGGATFMVPRPAGADFTYVSGVVLSVTASSGTMPSSLKVSSSLGWGAGASLDYTVGQTTTNQVVVPLGPDGLIWLKNRAGVVDVMARIVGYVYDDTLTGMAASWPGNTYFPVNATRVASGTVGARGHLSAKVAGVSSIPAGAKAVVVSLTGTAGVSPCYLGAVQGGTGWLGNADLWLTPHATSGALAVVPVGADGTIAVYNSAGSTAVSVDVEGYYMG